MRAKIFLAIIFLFTGKLFSQNDTLFFRHYNLEHGLSNRNVTSVIQDSLGFMWYGTHEGINKFDGYKFIPFKHDPKNPNSLVSDDVTCLAVEKNGMIWIGTKMKGVNLFSPYSHEFKIFHHDEKNPSSLSDDRISSLYVDSIHQVIWIGTMNGLNALDIKTKKISVYKHDEKNNFSQRTDSDNVGTLSNDKVTAVKVDKKGIVWIGTDGGGLNVFDYDAKKISSYQHDEKKNSVSTNIIRDVFVDKQHTVWIATPNSLNSLNPETGEFKIYRHDEKDEHSICSDDITSVYQDKFGKIWAGTAREGLCVYYPNSGKFFLYSHEKEVPNSLSSNKINTLSQGRSGMFWAATSDGGLNAFSPKTLKFNLFSPIPKGEDESVYEKISCMLTDKNKNLFIGTKENGIYVIGENHKVKNFRKEKSNANSISDNNVNCIFQDKDGKIFTGTDAGLNEFNSSSEKFRKIIFDKNYSDGEISAVYEDRDNMLWIGTKDGSLFSFDEASNVSSAYSNNNNSGGQLSENNITCITQSQNGIIWIGTYGSGLKKFDRKTGKFFMYRSDDKVAHPIGGNFINKIYEGKDGVLWISTQGGGLNVLHPNTNDFTVYTMLDGLPNNSLGSIFQDDSLKLWIGTDNGICRLSFDGEKIQQCRMFDMIDGLPTTEFYDGAICRNQNGRVLLSCKKGLITFHPDSLKNNPYKPPVIITDFMLFNKIIQPNDSSGILKNSISITKELFLNHNQNSFSFEFTAISFINPMKNKYAFMLEGFDKDWIFHNAQNRTATYTNLDPGEYIFKVKASNNDGIWNEEGTSVKIFIASPYYKKWWFVLLCVFFTASICYTIYWIRLQRILEMEKVRTNIARDLHDDMGSALSSISIYNEVAKKMTEEKVPEVASVLSNMGDTARESMDNMSDIVWAINPKNDKFSAIMERLRIFANPILEAKEIQLHLQFSESLGDLQLLMQHRKNIYLILKESINNIAKYSEAKNCFIIVEKKEKRMNIQIKDDGKGFEKTELTLGGNGLINMKNRAEELNGSLNISSEIVKGTIVNFQFEI
ncbi:MAG: hypothetical protein HY063_04030 [Bacteroidetes bacterium]|nr:hypothetical protein [Bacteroidota bacterium]